MNTAWDGIDTAGKGLFYADEPYCHATHPPADDSAIFTLTPQVGSAIEFVADQPGGAERILAQHSQLTNGRCSCCLVRPTIWPCSVAAIALISQQRREAQA